MGNKRFDGFTYSLIRRWRTSYQTARTPSLGRPMKALSESSTSRCCSRTLFSPSFPPLYSSSLPVRERLGFSTNREKSPHPSVDYQSWYDSLLKDLLGNQPLILYRSSFPPLPQYSLQFFLLEQQTLEQGQKPLLPLQLSTLQQPPFFLSCRLSSILAR